MKSISFLVFRLFLFIAVLSNHLYFLYRQGRDRYTPITRDAACGGLVHQTALSVYDPVHGGVGNAYSELPSRTSVRSEPGNLRPHVLVDAFAPFKVPDKEFYKFFDCGSHVKDRWEGY